MRMPVGPEDPFGSGDGDAEVCASAPALPDSSIATTTMLAMRRGHNGFMATSGVDGRSIGLRSAAPGS